MQLTVSGQKNLNNMPRTYLKHRHLYSGQDKIPVVSNYFRYAGAFTDEVRKTPWGRVIPLEIKAFKGPTLFSAKEGEIK